MAVPDFCACPNFNKHPSKQTVVTRKHLSQSHASHTMFFRIDGRLRQNYSCAMSRGVPTIEEILGPDGLLARKLPEFEFRSAQLRMALLLERALNERRPAIVEAGTGTGKTFGYLIPLILSGKKAVISTGTKNLQEQIFFKDIPTLSKATGLAHDAMMMKGRRNYLCLHKYHQFFIQSSLLKGEQAAIKKRLEAWIQKTDYADRAELHWLSDDHVLWDALSSSSEQCLGANCPFYEDCFLNRLRRHAAKKALIIVNHHLFFADLRVKRGGFGEIIPRFQVAVFDEAHTIEEIATTYFGESLSTRQLLDLVYDVQKEIKDLPKGERQKIERFLTRIRIETENLKNGFRAQPERLRLEEEDLLKIREGPCREILLGLRGLRKEAGSDPAEGPALGGLMIRAKELAHQLEEILTKKNPSWVNWYENRKRTLVFHASPLDISDRMNECLFDRLHSVGFTSATLSTNGNFDYIRSRIGLPEEALEGLYASHFDFEAQALLYIPKDLPPPGTPAFSTNLAERMLKLLLLSHGRALVLFTSYHNLNLVHDMLREKLPYKALRQGDAPRSVLLEAFKRDVNSVLFATGSFWQGVDVPGESLSCLIIDKLPFDSPGDPLVAARIEAIREEGKNPFMTYQVPSAIIALKQGLGRLIRRRSDRGLLAVLDSRVLTSRYGRFFLQSLPEMPLSSDLEEVHVFFDATP